MIEECVFKINSSNYLLNYEKNINQNHKIDALLPAYTYFNSNVVIFNDFMLYVFPNLIIIDMCSTYSLYTVVL